MCLQETEAPANPDMFGLGASNQGSLWNLDSSKLQSSVHCLKISNTRGLVQFDLPVINKWMNVDVDAPAYWGRWRGWRGWHGKEPDLCSEKQFWVHLSCTWQPTWTLLIWGLNWRCQRNSWFWPKLVKASMHVTTCCHLVTNHSISLQVLPKNVLVDLGTPKKALDSANPSFQIHAAVSGNCSSSWNLDCLTTRSCEGLECLEKETAICECKSGLEPNRMRCNSPHEMDIHGNPWKSMEMHGNPLTLAHKLAWVCGVCAFDPLCAVWFERFVTWRLKATVYNLQSLALKKTEAIDRMQKLSPLHWVHL